MNVINKNKAAHYIWGSSCNSWVLADTPGLSVKQEHMPSGTREKLHFHTAAQQFFFILKGEAAFYSGEEKKTIGEQEGILVLPGTKHFIANETMLPLEFRVISQPSTNNDRTEAGD